MRPLKEKLLIKDATINKVQFDKEWFFSFEDMAFYLKEDLSEVEFIHLPMLIDGVERRSSRYTDRRFLCSERVNLGCEIYSRQL